MLFNPVIYTYFNVLTLEYFLQWYNNLMLKLTANIHP